MEGQGVHVCVRECAYSYDEPPEAVLMRPACLHLVGERQSMLRSPGLIYLAFFLKHHSALTFVYPLAKLATD